MKIKNALSCFFLLICIGVMIVATACAPVKPSSEQKVLKFGSLLPFSGPASMYGERGSQIDQVYIELLNEDGGIKIGDDTYRIELICEDDQFTPAGAAAAARKLIYNDNIVAIMGYIGPGYSALSPVTNPEKVMLFTRTGGVIYNPQRDTYVVFGTPTGEIFINQAITVMQAHPDLHVLAWTGSMDDRRMAETAFASVDKMLEKNYGIKSVRDYYPVGTTNFVPYLVKMADQGAEVIFVGGTILEVGLIAKQRWQMGYKWPICHSSDNIVDIFYGICGKDAAQGIMGNRVNPLECKKVIVSQYYRDMTKRILERYKEKYGKPVDNHGPFAITFPHFSQYFECAQRIGTTDPDLMMKAIKGGTFDSFLGKYTFGGAKTYGQPIVFGYPCSMGVIKGDEDVYMGEYPLTDADMWHDYMNVE